MKHGLRKRGSRQAKKRTLAAKQRNSVAATHGCPWSSDALFALTLAARLHLSPRQLK
jgi:hypothetical protein